MEIKNLIEAAVNGNLSEFVKVYKKCNNPHIEKEGESLLCHAIAGGNIPVIEYLIH